LARALVIAALAFAALDLRAADRILSYEGRPGAIYFSSDSKTMLASRDSGGIRVWDVESGNLIADKSGLKGAFLLSPSLYAVIDDDKHTIAIWSLVRNSKIRTFRGTNPSNLAVSHDTSLLAISFEEAQSVEIWSLATGKRTQLLADGAGGAANLVFSPNDQTLVSANNDNDIRMWNSGSGQLVARTDDPTGPMFGGDFTSDGKLLIVGGLDETVYVRDANTLAVVRQLKGQGEVIAQAVTSPDVRTLVTSGRDATDSRKPAKVLVWDLPSGKIKRVFQAAHPAFAMAFSPDGRWLALSLKDQQISILDLQSPAAK
jgi:WD40 repeat protein